MFTSRNFKALLPLFAPLLFFHPHAAAQSGRKPPPPKPVPELQPAPTPIDYTHFDKVKVVVSEGVYNFVEALNGQGRLGYRLEKTVSYGGPLNYRKYAAVLHLDPGHSYEYVSDSMPEDMRRYGDPLNYHARRGYGLAHAYALTHCRTVDVSLDPDYPNDTSPRQELQAVQRSNVLLFMRRDAAGRQAKEYRVFTGLFTMDGGQKKELQAELDAAAAPGFRPVRLLFSGAGPDIFYATVVAERDLDEAAPRKVEYRLVKEVFGFEDEVNRLAAAGSRYVDGGRVQFVKIALLERQAGGANAYTFVGDSGDQKRFDGEVAAGNSYAGLLVGDLTCTSDSSLFLQKLVFARDAGGAPARAYKILEISDHKTARQPGVLTNAAVSGLQRLLAEGFRVRDIFYAYGLYVILERQAEAPASQVQTSER